MSWRERDKELYIEIQKEVIQHIAPDEVKNNVEIEETIYGRRFERRTALKRFIEERRQAIFDDGQWPKTIRRKKITCPVTGELTDHAFGLSKRAWQLIRNGVLYEQKEEKRIEQTQTYCFPDLWGHGLATNYEYTGQGRLSEYAALSGARHHIYELAKELLRGLGIEYTEKTLGYNSSVEQYGWIWLPCEEYDYKKANKLVVVNLTEDQAEWVRAIITQVQWNLNHRVAQAKKDGSSLLLSLAEGSAAIERFNAVRDEVKNVSYDES